MCIRDSTQIASLNSNPGGDVLEIDLKSLGWSYGALKTSTNHTTNLINLNDGKLVWYEKVGSNQELRYWNPEPSFKQDATTNKLQIKTPSYTFDLPNQDKNISTVYVSYKNGAGIVLKGFTDTNDGGAAVEHTLATLSGTNDTTYRLSLIHI